MADKRMNTTEMIKEIHASDAFGCFSEAGCGTAVSSKLFEVAGASATVFAAESPYSKEYQLKKFFNLDAPPEKLTRAVSFEMVKQMMSWWAIKYESKKINTFYVSSFQIGDERNETSTHGWIGFRYKGHEHYYHISIHEAMSRVDYIKLIGEIGLKIMHKRITGEDYTHQRTCPAQFIPTDCCIDAVKYSDGKDVELSRLFEMIEHSENENFICVKNGQQVRLEVLFRDEPNIILYKGSFNPVHNGHIQVVELVNKKYNSNPVFVISSEVYQKGHIGAEELVRRVKMINDLGYSAIVTRYGYFNQNVRYIRSKFPDKHIVFVVGSDTMNRIVDSTYKILRDGSKFYNAAAEEFLIGEVEKFKRDFKNTSFFVVNRPGYTLAPEITEHLKGHHGVYDEAVDISSSEIRKLYAAGNFDKIKELVPEKIHQSLINQIKQTV